MDKANVKAVQDSLNGLESLNRNAVQASLNGLDNLTKACTHQLQWQHKSTDIYVTRSGKRYNSAQKFKMELFIAPHCALRAVYNDASRSILAFSVLEL